MGYDNAVRLVCLGLVLAIARPAIADRAAADKLADDANALASQGKLAEAAAEFRAAYAEDPRPKLLCNVGVAYYKANDLPRAAFHLERCRAVGGQLDAAFLDNVDQVLAAVRRVLAAGEFTPVTILTDPATASATFDHGPIDEPIIGQQTVWLPFGTYRLHVHEDGYVDRDEPVHAADHTAITTRVTLERPQPIKPPVHAERIAPPSTPPPAPGPSKIPAIAATAGTVVVGVLAGLAYFHASDLNDQAGKTQDYSTYRDLRASTLGYKHLAWLGGGFAAAGAVASTLLWYRGVHVEAAPDRAVVVLARTF